VGLPQNPLPNSEDKKIQEDAMSSTALMQKVEDLAVNINEEIHVNAPLSATFDALIEQLTEGMTAAENKPMPMKIEAWPGGRWWRDLGNGDGHLWAHVQAIKRPTLLEFSGPLMMSLAVASNVQYRLKEEAGGTVISFHHYALGFVPADFRKGFGEGWKMINQRAKERAEKKK
jgi:uncharacterized protein YndB with AHSA1/START domain